MNNQQGLVNIVITGIIIVLVGVVGFYLFRLPPIKYWVKTPTNFNECREASRGFIIKTLPAQCEFRGQNFVDQLEQQSTPVSTPIPSPTPAPESKNNIVSISLGEQFTLMQGQVAKIINTGLEIEITQFYNNPCKGVCFWSGVGIGFEYRFNREQQKGINLVQAFGHQTTIVKTDYETYAQLIVEKMK